jgi:hypothetical protein
VGNLVLHLDGFAWEAISDESDALGVPVDQLIAFAVLYYLADIDSGRIARRIPDTAAGSDVQVEKDSRARKPCANCASIARYEEDHGRS